MFNCYNFNLCVTNWCLMSEVISWWLYVMNETPRQEVTNTGLYDEICFHCLLSCVFCLQVFSCKDASALCALCLTWITGLGSSTAALHPRDLSSWAQLDLLIHLRLQRQYHYRISFLLSKDTTHGKLTALGWNLKIKYLCCFELWKRLCYCHTVEYR